MPAADPEVITLRRRVVEENEMDITPMIDITFLLLIFFVVTNRPDSSTKVPLPVARYGAVLSAKDAVVITVASIPDDLPLVYKGDKTVEKERFLATSALEQDDSISEYVIQEVAKDPNKQAVLILADRNLKSRDVQRIARAACRSSTLKLYYKVEEE